MTIRPVRLRCAAPDPDMQASRSRISKRLSDRRHRSAGGHARWTDAQPHPVLSCSVIGIGIGLEPDSTKPRRLPYNYR